MNGDIGLATANPPAGPWTKSVSNQFISRGAGGAWNDVFIVTDDLVKIAGVYYLFYHADDNSTIHWGIPSSSDLVTWTKSTLNPIIAAREDIIRLRGTLFSAGYVLNSATGNIHLVQMLGAPVVQTEEWPPFSAGGRQGVSVL